MANGRTGDPFVTQYRNEPQGPLPEKPEADVCDEPHCEVCKSPVKNEPRGGFCGRRDCRTCKVFRESQEWLATNKSKKEVKMSNDSKSYEYQKLYEVITTYGGDRDNVIVKRTDVVAENEERARMQVNDDIEPDWDLDYVEQEVEEVAEIRVKRKPREVHKV